MQKGFIFVVGCLSLLLAQPALATNKVSSPDIVKGRTEFEYRFGYDRDDVGRRDAVDQHRIVLNHAFTDHYRTEIKLDATGDNDGRDWTFFEWSNRVQLIKDGGTWPSLSLQENYKFAMHHNVADRLEGTLLVAKDTGSFSHAANISLEGDVGDDANAGGTDLNIGWRTRYANSPAFDPGVELYANYPLLIGPGPMDDRRYMAGPTFYGEIAQDIRYDVGLLFGLNDAAANERLKAIVTYIF